MRTYQEVFASAFEDELQKIAEAKEASAASQFVQKNKKNLGIAAAGAVGYETLRRANEDRRMGRMVRRQNQGY